VKKKANRKRWIFLSKKKGKSKTLDIFCEKKGNRKRWIISNGDNLNG